MVEGFIKNPETLEEKSNQDDLLDCSVICEKFSKKIDAIPSASVIALVGPYGSGKSTMLHQIKKQRAKEEYWIEFDAWKYPDRKDLWEGFVLDTTKFFSSLESNKVKQELDGTQHDNKKTIISAISKIPGLAVIETLNHFIKTSPAKRVDEVQTLLRDFWNKQDKDIYIILEDIDRSGDSGIFFLETLKQFLRISYLKDKKVVIIVPIANQSYEKNMESYLKCVDYFEFFDQGNIELSRFVDEVFDENLFEGNVRTQVISFLEGLFKENKSMTMRLLKLILRKADLVYKNQIIDDHDPDFRVTLCFEASKYHTNTDSNTTYFDHFKRNSTVSSPTIYSAYLMAIQQGYHSIYKNREETNFISTKQFNLVQRENNNKKQCPSVPWYYNNYGLEPGFAITNFYSEY